MVSSSVNSEERKLICHYLDKSLFQYFFSNKISSIYSFKLLEYEDFMLFFSFNFLFTVGYKMELVCDKF